MCKRGAAGNACRPRLSEVSCPRQEVVCQDPTKEGQMPDAKELKFSVDGMT